MKGKLLLFSFLILFCAVLTPTVSGQKKIGDEVDYNNPVKYRIAGYTVVGAQYTDVQAIKLFSGLQEGQEITIPGDQIADALRKLWKQKLFTDLRFEVGEIRGGDLYLVLHLKEMPRLAMFKFEGVKKSEADNLREKLNLRIGVVCNENLKRTSINIIRDYYIDKGYFNAVVTATQTPINKIENGISIENGVLLSFDIDKGNRMKIESIDLQGANPELIKKLKRQMKDTKEARWWRIFKASKYLDEKYEEDKTKVIAYYNKQGYRNARIESDTLIQISANRLAIKMKIIEDKKFYFRNISFVGNTKHRSTELDSILNIQRGDIYNADLLNSRLNFNQAGRDVASLYTDDGYLGFNVFPVETLIQPDSIDIEVRMYEGKQYRVGKVTIIGNSKTNDHVIYREIRTRPGDLFSRSDVMRSQRELAALNYFDPQKFDIKPIQNDEKGTVDLEYVVEEKPSDQVQLSGGWGGGRVVGTLQLAFNNISMRKFLKPGSWTPVPAGDGQRLSIMASSNGTYFQSYNLSFTEPWLGGRKPNSLTVSILHSVQTNGQPKKRGGEINPFRQSLYITGGNIFFGKRLQRPDDWFVLSAGLTFQHFNLKNYQYFFAFNNGYTNNLNGNITIERNSISDPIYPTWGTRVTLTTKFTFPYTLWGRAIQGKEYDYAKMTQQQKYDWVEYYKIKFTAHWYTALNNHKERKLVLHSNIGFGFLGSYNPKLGQSPFERFYLGGVYLSGFLLDGREIVNLRGYDDLSLTDPVGRGGQPIGAPIITKYSLELRYPISTNPNATVFVQSFLEAARTWTNFQDYDPFNLYRSTGAGVRIFLPQFGLLGFDYGWRLDDVPGRSTMARSQFHFSIGMNLGEL